MYSKYFLACMDGYIQVQLHRSMAFEIDKVNTENAILLVYVSNITFQRNLFGDKFKICGEDLR